MRMKNSLHIYFSKNESRLFRDIHSKLTKVSNLVGNSNVQLLDGATVSHFATDFRLSARDLLSSSTDVVNFSGEPVSLRRIYGRWSAFERVYICLNLLY